MTNRSLGLIVREQNPLMLPPEDTLGHACQRMWKRRVGAVLVVDAQHRLVGIFTGRDAVRAIASGKAPTPGTTIRSAERMSAGSPLTRTSPPHSSSARRADAMLPIP